MSKFLLPCSCLPPYPASSWAAVKHCLTSQLSQLDSVLVSQLSQNGVTDQVDAGPDYQAFLARHKAVAQEARQWTIPAWSPALECAGVEGVHHRVMEWALRMEELFPSSYLPVLETGKEVSEVVLTRDQVRCLLANMLLCTLKPAEHNKYWVTFQPWLTRETSPSVAYLTCLLRYFSSDKASTMQGEQEVVFRRVICQDSLPDWGNCQETLIKLEVFCPSKIGDDPHEVEIDFANKDVGFGPGGTQEEIIFGMTPEACPAVLISPTLLDTECLLISGARRMGRPSGYGFSVKYDGEGDGLPRTILCMDALELGDGVSDPKQAGGQLLARELVKCYIGFRSVRGSAVGTGAWGCGAFGGDRDVKLAIQVVAASAAGVESLRYRTGDRDLGKRLKKVVKFLETEKFTVAMLVAKLETFSVSKPKESFLEWIQNS
jgi:poly(ADP-ribose) glycohydrolase